MENLLPKDGQVYYYDNFLTHQQADSYYEQLKNRLAWRNDKIWLFGRWVAQPRLVAWHADKGLDYTYSGMTMEAQAWVAPLLTLKAQIEQKIGHSFNSVLANYYRNGQDSMGWHSDDEKELGKMPVMASLSLGVERRFRFKHKKNKDLRLAIQLKHGSLLIMQGKTQTYWQHTIPKSKPVTEGRINLTFRTIVQSVK